LLRKGLEFVGAEQIGHPGGMDIDLRKVIIASEISLVNKLIVFGVVIEQSICIF
jgi:hypothetical protein